MKEIRTEDAIGHVLCQDITQIIVGKTKGPVFKKGHIVTVEDIPVLLSVGKEHLFVWEKDDTMYHENEGAQILCKMALGEHMTHTEPSEGKIDIFADCDGLLKIDSKTLMIINSHPRMMIATRHGNTPVKKGDKLAGTRIIPLVIKKDEMDEICDKVDKETNSKSILKILPYKHKKIAIVSTGSEVYKGLIKDTFTPTLIDKMSEYDTEIISCTVSDDDDKMTTSKIEEALSIGADIVLCTGGMSVDPDDRTPLAIKNTGCDIVTYGAPVLPGAMFLLGYKGDKVICGLPGCVMYSKRTIFDLMIPRIMADDRITYDEISSLGEGGLCLNCKVCTYPNCGFGK